MLPLVRQNVLSFFLCADIVVPPRKKIIVQLKATKHITVVCIGNNISLVFLFLVWFLFFFFCMIWVRVNGGEGGAFKGEGHFLPIGRCREREKFFFVR